MIAEHSQMQERGHRNQMYVVNAQGNTQRVQARRTSFDGVAEDAAQLDTLIRGKADEHR